MISKANHFILKMSINPCKLFLMMTRKSCQNYHFNRMFNFQGDMTTMAKNFPGFIKSKTYFGTDEKTQEPSLITISQWDCRQDWDVWEGSDTREEIMTRFWRNHNEITVKHTVLFPRALDSE